MTEAHRFEFTPDHGNLPYWARSTNPIVRLHLGLYWRTLPPQIAPILIIAICWSILILSAAFLPHALNVSLPIVLLSMLAMPLIVLSILIMPFVILLYAHVLLTISVDAARHMQSEMQNQTLPLLMATPMSLDQIFLGKVAAALWRRMDDVMLTLQLAALLGMPILLLTYTESFTFEETSFAMPAIIVLIYLASLVRLILEPLMFGLISVMVGTAVPFRAGAITASVSLGAFYVLIMNLMRHMPGALDSLQGILLMDAILPIVLPVIVIGFCLWMARWLVTTD